ncbi:MAG: hypothetical protein ACRCW0_01955 [Clostridium sp.]
MVKYKIKSKEEGYTGNGAGISFLNGIAFTDSEWVVQWHKRKGYEVEKNVDTLDHLTVEELKKIAIERDVEVKNGMKKAEIIELLEGD